MNIWNHFASNPCLETATIQQIAMHIFRNFDKAIKKLIKSVKTGVEM